jgi:CheY-like chemotaxis protein
MLSVLAIESHPEQAALLRDLVGRQARGEITLVDSIDAACEAIDRRVPDLILLSGEMPVHDEVHLISQLRARPRTALVEVQLASAFAEQFKTPDRRSACRIVNVDWATIVIDGSNASLIDLSLLGAQVVSSEILQPRRPLQVVLEGNQQTVRCHAGIVWSAFDVLQPTETPCYRAGLEFKDASQSLLERLCLGRMSFE